MRNAHKHYTVSSLKERYLFYQLSKQHPELFSTITYSYPESLTPWDVIYTTTASTKRFILDVKARKYHSGYAGYLIEKDKYTSLIKSADTFNVQYVNFLNDNQVLFWDLKPEDNITWKQSRMQHNDLTNQSQDKTGADLHTNKAKRYTINYTLKQAQEDAEKEYNKRLSPTHKKHWKHLKKY